MQSINAEKIEDIDLLLDYLHDRFYDLRKIKWEGEVITIPTSTVSIDPIETKKGLLRGKKYGVYEAFLHIYNANSYEVLDDDSLGEGDFQSIIYDNQKIFINGSSPVRLVIDVKGLRMSLEITDKVINSISGFRKNFLRS